VSGNSSLFSSVASSDRRCGTQIVDLNCSPVGSKQFDVILLDYSPPNPPRNSSQVILVETS
jgi:hypothetical protein